MLAAIEAPIDVRRLVGELTVAEQQMVQIAAAVGSGARVIIFDEPTSSLSQHETEHFYALLDRLRARDVTCVFVSHRMQEIFRLCDTITVLRDGRHVATKPIGEIDEAALVQLMIGRRLEEYLPADDADGRRRRGAARRGAGEPAQVRRHQLLGSRGRGGGHRRAWWARAAPTSRTRSSVSIPRRTGASRSAGIPLGLRSPAEAMRAGVGFVPEDRKRHGLVLSMRALENVTLPTLRSLARAGWLRAGAERRWRPTRSRGCACARPISTPSTAGLSGGNQQKLVLAKWLAARCRVLILDEPTRGVDVGAKAEIHALIGRLAAEGTGVLLISSELPELVALSTRVLVLRDGRLVGELARAEADPESLLRMMAGLDPGTARACAPDIAPGERSRTRPLLRARVIREVSDAFRARFPRAKSHPEYQKVLYSTPLRDTVPPE